MGYSRFIAFILGLVVVAAGVLGFIDYFSPGGQLFGVFQVSMINDIFHIVTGFIGMVVAIPSRRRYAAWYILEMGIVYAAITIIGFVYDGNIFGLTTINLNDTLLHAGITLFAFSMSILILLNQPQAYTGMRLSEEPQYR